MFRSSKSDFKRKVDSLLRQYKDMSNKSWHFFSMQPEKKDSKTKTLKYLGMRLNCFVANVVALFTLAVH